MYNRTFGATMILGILRVCFRVVVRMLLVPGCDYYYSMLDSHNLCIRCHVVDRVIFKKHTVGIWLPNDASESSNSRGFAIGVVEKALHQIRHESDCSTRHVPCPRLASYHALYCELRSSAHPPNSSCRLFGDRLSQTWHQRPFQSETRPRLWWARTSLS